MNVHVVTNQKRYNLGMARCTGRMTAVRTLEVAKERLEMFGLEVEQMVGLTTDGASTMVCMGETLDCIHQLCLGKFLHKNLHNIALDFSNDFDTFAEH